MYSGFCSVSGRGSCDDDMNHVIDPLTNQLPDSRYVRLEVIPFIDVSLALMSPEVPTCTASLRTEHIDRRQNLPSFVA